MLTKSREEKLKLKIIEEFGGDRKPLLMNRIEQLMTYQKNRLVRNMESYLDGV